MSDLPADLLAALPDGAGPVAERWWATLPEADRRRIVGLWDDRLEVKFFAPQADAAGRVDGWDQLPAVRGGRFIPPDDDGRAEWGPGYFEHLLQHPDLVLAYEPPHRTFHLGCTQHPAAKVCLAAGSVPEGFECPVGSETCPMRRLRGATLTPVLRPGITNWPGLGERKPSGTAVPTEPGDSTRRRRS